MPLVARGGTLLTAERAARSDLTSGPACFPGACIGAVPTFILATAVLISAITWAIATATNARTGLLVALGAAALAGAGVTWLNWLIELGDQL